MTCPGCVDSTDIADGTITEFDLGTDSVGADEIKTASVGFIELATNAVRTNDILDETIQSRDIKDETITTDDIQDGTITTDDIQDGTITTDDIADDVIKSAVLLRGGTGTVPVVGKRYIGMDNVYSLSHEAFWILPFTAEITNFRNSQNSHNPDSTTTYRLFRLGNVELMSCSANGQQFACSDSGSVTVPAGIVLWVEVETTCAGTCPSPIQGIVSSIGYKPA